MAPRLTGTGLDRLVEIIQKDPGLNRRLSDSDINKGAEAASELNHMLLDGIREMGLANDELIDASDLRALGDWIQADSVRNQKFLGFYGTNNKGVETGFQLVEQEDSSTRLFDEDAVDEVADGIYSIGFGYEKGRLLDVDGNLYRSLNLTSGWINRLLTDGDMESLKNVEAEVTGTTGTGLDHFVTAAMTDPGLIQNVSRTDMATAARAVDALNHMYLEGIRELGLVNDGSFDRSDVQALDEWVRLDAGRHAEFVALDQDYHLIQKKGSTYSAVSIHGDMTTKEGAAIDIGPLIDDGRVPHTGHVISHGMRGLYHIGAGTQDGRVINDEGKPDISTKIAAAWLDQILTDADIASLNNPEADVAGTTGTGLDLLVEAVLTDPGLQRNLSQTDINTGALAVDAMNHLYLDGIREMGLANDGIIDRSDIQAIDSWVRADAARLAEFMELHKGYDLIYNKGADYSVLSIDGSMFGHEGHDMNVDDGITPHKGHVINHAMKGIYHIGFGVEKGRIINDEGNPDVSTRVPAEWFDQLLGHHDMMMLNNVDGTALAKGTTGTGLDKLVDIILDDPGLARNVSRADIAEAARSADAMNNIIVDTIGALGLAKDGRINDVDVEKINKHIRTNDALHDEFLFLRGQQGAAGTESGFHLVQGNGGSTKLFDKFAVNNVADAVYHVGFETQKNMFLDDDGDRSYSVVRVAEWIDELYFA